VLTVELNGNMDESWPIVSIEGDPAFEVTLGPVRILSKGQICWEIKALQNGYNRIMLQAGQQQIEKGLAVAGDSLTQVYRIDIPGKDQTVFGVGMKATSDAKEEVDIDATHQMAIVDFEGYSKAAYFPYEVLVNGSDVEALHMRFRMAVHFPDLSMTGEHGFTKLMSAPGATEDALEAMVKAD